MIINTIDLIELVASEGMVLTNGETYSDVIFLGTNDSPSNWWEVPKEEVDDE